MTSLSDVEVAPALTLRARALLAAHAAKQQVDEQDRQQQQQALERERRHLLDLLAAGLDIYAEEESLLRRKLWQTGWDEPWEADFYTYTEDGLTFSAARSGGGLIGLVRVCPRCQGLVTEGFSGIGGLGELLESPVSHRGCPVYRTQASDRPAPKVPTLGERLESLIRDIAEGAREP